MQQELFVKMVMDAWQTQIKSTDELFDQLTDEQLMKEVSPGRNRGVYLLGHLIAVHDRMLPLLNLGEQMFPALYPVFVEAADDQSAAFPPVQELKNHWKKLNAKLTEQFARLSSSEWFQRHTSVSEEDFKKEPHRNRLNVVINRTNHLANHNGQLLLLKPRSA